MRAAVSLASVVLLCDGPVIASEPQAVPSPVAMDEPSRTPSEAGGADVDKQTKRDVPSWDHGTQTANAEDESGGSNEAVDKEPGKVLAAPAEAVRAATARSCGGGACVLLRRLRVS